MSQFILAVGLVLRLLFPQTGCDMSNVCPASGGASIVAFNSWGTGLGGSSTTCVVDITAAGNTSAGAARTGDDLFASLHFISDSQTFVSAQDNHGNNLTGESGYPVTGIGAHFGDWFGHEFSIPSGTTSVVFTVTPGGFTSCMASDFTGPTATNGSTVMVTSTGGSAAWTGPSQAPTTSSVPCLVISVDDNNTNSFPVTLGGSGSYTGLGSGYGENNDGTYTFQVYRIETSCASSAPTGTATSGQNYPGTTIYK